MKAMQAEARTITTLIVCVLAVVANAACGSSPTEPALSDSPSLFGGQAVIEGFVVDGGGASATAESFDVAAASPAVGPSGVTVSVLGTSISDVTDGDGEFRLVNTPSGNLILHFQAPGVNAQVTVQVVGSTSHLKIKVKVDSSSATIVEQQHGTLVSFEGVADSADTGLGMIELEDNTDIAVDELTWWDTGGSLFSVADVAAALGAGQTVDIVGLGTADDDGSILANVIKATTDEATASFQGLVTAVDPLTQTLTLDDGTVVAVDAATVWDGDGDLTTFAEIAAAFAAGDSVEVKGVGTPQADGSVLATEIEAEVDNDGEIPANLEEVLEALDDLIEDVQELVAAGKLGHGNGNALISKLQNVRAKLEKGNVTPAINQLGAFINQVEAFVRTGKLSADDGNALVEAAQEIIEALQAS